MASKTEFLCDLCGNRVRFPWDFYTLEIPHNIAQSFRVMQDGLGGSVPVGYYKGTFPKFMKSVELKGRPLEFCSRGCVHDAIDQIGAFHEAQGA